MSNDVAFEFLLDDFFADHCEALSILDVMTRMCLPSAFARGRLCPVNFQDFPVWHKCTGEARIDGFNAEPVALARPESTDSVLTPL